MTPTPSKHIEDVLSSRTRLKILKILIDSQLTPSEVARTVGVSSVKTREHLQALEAESILTHVTFGKRIRYYKFNETSPKAKAVRSLIETFKQELPKSRGYG
jgi:predicted transcriptional regulator